MSSTCFNCFRHKPDDGACIYCGYDHTDAEERFPLALKPGTILANRYYLGRVLGQGGFGITYIALDGNTQSRVALKEYLPRELAMRDQNTQSLQIYSANDLEKYEYGKQQFLNEAKTLAQFYGNEHIISIQSYFEENGTAYFAMEYMQGVNLKQYMVQQGRTLEVYEANRILLPVMESLEWVHSKGIIHRDISPDNIMIRRDGTAKLIDFGSARYSTGEVSRSLDVILKHGFAPKEQYTRRGRQGPFTDVYAMAATYYYAITGKVPPDAIERTEEDTLIRPSALGVKIQKRTEEALLKGLAVPSSKRWQSMREFYSAMVQSMPNPFQPEEAKNGRKSERKSQRPQNKQQVPGDTPRLKTQNSQSTGSGAPNNQTGTTSTEGKKTAEPDPIAKTASAEKPRKKSGLIAALVLIAAIIVTGVVFLKPGVLPISKPAVTEASSTPVPTATPVPTSTPTPEPAATPAPTASVLSSPAPNPVLEMKDYEVGDTLFFGAYEQDNDTSDGKEDIEWQVLAKEDNRILVISRYGLDCQQYNVTKTAVTWETCTLRQWLNGPFLDSAFSAQEQAMIPIVTVNADKNPSYSTDPGNSTEDQVFLLSIQEVKTYFTSNVSGKCAPTEFAAARGAYTDDDLMVDGKGTCWWWLRSPGSSPDLAAYVSMVGSVYYEGDPAQLVFGAVRPALWIDLALPEDSDAVVDGEADYDGEESSEQPSDYEKEKVSLLSRGMKLLADDGTLLVGYLENSLEIMLTGLQIEESYVTNQPGDKNDLEYGWIVSFSDENHDYDVSSTSWRFDPGKNTIKTIDQMQQSLFVDHHNEANAAMRHSEEYIIWSVAVPEQFAIDCDSIESFEITICIPGLPYEVKTVPALPTGSDENAGKEASQQDEVNQLLGAEVGSYVRFGSYEQDNDTSNGKEDIEWQLLAKENNRLLVISKYALDSQLYNTTYTDVTWEKCSLRKWLNSTFLNDAFSAEEQVMIPTVNVSADKNPSYDTNPGNNTQDKVFLLSIPEVNKYFSTDEVRKCVPTAFAVAQGVYTSDRYLVEGKATCWWWLRSPGDSSDRAADINIVGSVLDSGSYVDNVLGAVRPALWINLES